MRGEQLHHVAGEPSPSDCQSLGGPDSRRPPSISMSVSTMSSFRSSKRSRLRGSPQSTPAQPDVAGQQHQGGVSLVDLAGEPLEFVGR